MISSWNRVLKGQQQVANREKDSIIVELDDINAVRHPR